MTRLAYIAAPYSATSPEVMKGRAKAVRKFSGWLLDRGICYPLSPVAMWHDEAAQSDRPTDAATFAACNRAYFNACSVMYLLKLDGWDKSAGVEMELEWARDRRMPVIGAVLADGGFDLEVVG